MKVSASQIETANRSMRRWWLENVAGLRTTVAMDANLVFGTVLHSVIERYLEADDQGRDQQGNKVELYPDGWWMPDKRDNKGKEEAIVELSTTDRILIKTLVDKAIEQGVIVRQPHRKIETQIQAKLGKFEEEEVELIGIIDYELPESIQDHKTAKNTRYIKNNKPTSDKYLGKNIQMMLYAYWKMFLNEHGKDLQEIELRHNYFVKDMSTPKLPVVAVRVTRQQVKEFYHENIEKTIKDMVHWKHVATRWEDIPEPTDKNACKAYGGCPFHKLCNGLETIDDVKERLATIESYQQNQIIENTKIKDEKTMGFKETMEKLKARQQASLNKLDKDTPKPAVKIEPEVKQDDPLVGLIPDGEPLLTAPWAYIECGACKDETGNATGVSSNGKPCKICDWRNTKEGNPTSSSYIIEASSEDNGILLWENKRTGEKGKLRVPGVTLDEPKVVDKTIDKPVEEVKKPVEKPIEKPVEKPKSVKEKKPVDTKVKDFVENEIIPIVKGLTLVIGGTVSSKPAIDKGIHITELLRAVGEGLSKAKGVESYYNLQAFDRRDLITANVETIMNRLKEEKVRFISATGLEGAPDLRNLVNALRPYCDVVIEMGA